MANSNGVTWKWVVGILMAGIVGAAGYILDDLKSDIGDLRDDIKELQTTASTTQADVTVIRVGQIKMKEDVLTVKHTVDSIKWSQ